MFNWRRLWLVLPFLMSSWSAVQAEASSIPGSTVTLAWVQSPDTNVTGYLLCCGLTSGQYLNQVEVGRVTNVTVMGLSPSATYYFVVIAHDAVGNQAPPSNELQVPIMPQPLALVRPVAPQLAVPSRSGAGISLTFRGNAGAMYAIQATQDFINWSTVWTALCVTSGPLTFVDGAAPGYPRRFYRLVAE